MKRFNRRVRLGVCTLMASLLVAGPVAAASSDARSSPARASLNVKLSPAALKTIGASRAALDQQPASGSDEGSFFTTKKGIATLVLIGAGFGYALYSKNHDRVWSPTRQ